MQQTEAKAGPSGSAAGRRALFCCLYFAEGAPLGFLFWALPVRLELAGVPILQTGGLLAAIVLPWALKFLWAPAVDLCRTHRFGLRNWIVSAQILMGATLIPVMFLDPRRHMLWFMTALLAHAVAASTQDASIDSLAITVLPESERGVVNGWMQVGMLAARAVFGGGALLLADFWGDRAVIATIIAVVWGTALIVWLRLPEPEAPITGHPGERLARFGHTLWQAVRRRETLVGLLFAATVEAGFKSATALGGPFLIDKGATQSAVGFFFLFPVVACMAVGAWIGGWAADRVPRRAAVGLFEAVTATCVGVMGLVALRVPPADPPVVFLALMAVLYFSIGLATSSLYALFMDLTDRRLAATQFCMFMAAVNLCESWSTRLLSHFVFTWGYGVSFLAVAMISYASLVLLPWLKPSTR